MVALLLLGAACSDDTAAPNPDTSQLADQSTVFDQGGPLPEARPPAEQCVNPEKGSPDLAKGPSTEKGLPSPDGIPAGANSGAICKVPENKCPTAADECVIVGGGAPDKGMCLMKCTTKLADCPTADPSTQKSICFLDYAGPPAEIFCAYMCQYLGKTYKCPTGSTCKSIGANTSVCVQ
jgi:hypothetical protein